MVGRKGRQRDAVFFVSVMWLFYSSIRFTEHIQVGLCSNLIVQKEDFLLEGFFLHMVLSFQLG